MAGYEPTVWVDNSLPRLNAAALNKIEQAIADLSTATVVLDPDIVAIGALTGTGFLKRTGDDTWVLDTNTYALGTHGHAISDVTGLQTALDGKQPVGSYLTANQTITLSGDATGSGTTSITVTVADDSHSHTGTTISGLDAGDTTTGTFNIARIPTGTTGTTVALGNHGHAISDTSGLQTALDLKAPLASPALTGTPTAPTAAAATNTTQIATTAFVRTEVTNLVDAAPTTLDTLNELAAALGDDPNFATTVTTALGTKAPSANPTFTGTVTLPSTTSIGSVDSTELGYLNGVTSAIQTQLNAKVDEVASTDNAIVRFNGTGGSVQDSGATVDDDGNIAVSSSTSGKVTIATTSAVNNSGSSVYLDVPTPAADHWSQVMYRVGGSNRWKILRTMDAESGSDAGSNLEITSYSDSLAQNVRLRLDRASGKITVGAVGTTSGIELGSSGPRIAAGAGAPSHAAPIGSKWRNTTTGIDFIKRGTGSTAADWVPTARVTVSSTAPTSPVDGDIWVDTSTEPYRCNSGASTSLSWNSAITPGPYPYLMHGTDNANGPGDGYYYYLTNFCYTASSGNLTQMAIPYTGSPGIKYRNRYSGTWTSWYTA